jgi:hypothetical protein
VKKLYSFSQRYNRLAGFAVHTLQFLSLYSHSHALTLLLLRSCTLPLLYNQKWCYICRPIATYYHLIWTNHERRIVPRAFERQWFLSRLSFVWTRLTHDMRIGFADYKSLICTATDNPFLLYTVISLISAFLQYPS